MKVKFEKSFKRDLKKIKDKTVLAKVKDTIEILENIGEIAEFKGDLEKLRSGSNQWRIKIGDYRIGLEIEEDTVIFVRILHRKDIYKHFP
ncbi:type II toxin-antitoxin system RelE/ParE family toxin [Thermosulfurimonas sp. F29]|uniref:type II toxin-antitoxin system RelE family toxin n=1 Tax=Thermosulfurimonas sp. F29 TaxID=2867247 RepID=UPI001C839600|nr:type II toxin-antitoxin system RelE/ParE family toxin [Thermosulfurimonas sp. F29]MBX6423784.1 type II toxin-antitoxin system RelE/ParE family toxin [Thermosulfurimonas sp. F29]